MKPIIKAVTKALVPTIFLVGSMIYLLLNYSSEGEVGGIDVFRTSLAFLMLLVLFTLSLLGREYRRINPDKYKESMHPLESPLVFLIWLLVMILSVRL